MACKNLCAPNYWSSQFVSTLSVSAFFPPSLVESVFTSAVESGF